MQLRNVESRLVEGKIRLSGEILVSILYNDEEEGEHLSWYETTVPLDAQAECGVMEDDCIWQVQMVPLTMELEVKPDYDWEERILVMRYTHPYLEGRKDKTFNRSVFTAERGKTSLP